MKRSIILAVLVAIAGLRGDTDSLRIAARAVASSDGAFFMLVIPVSEKRDSWIWTTYAMGSTGAFKEVWTSQGTFSREMYLSDDGHHVVCLDSWPTGRPSDSSFVIAVFEKGRTLKVYRPGDLLRDRESIQHSTSHYRWLADSPLPVARGGSLFFTTIEGTAFQLSMATGVLTPR